MASRWRASNPDHVQILLALHSAQAGRPVGLAHSGEKLGRPVGPFGKSYRNEQVAEPEFSSLSLVNGQHQMPVRGRPTSSSASVPLGTLMKKSLISRSTAS